MSFIYKIDTKEYPMVPVRGLWAFPDTVVHFDCQRAVSKKAVEDAKAKILDGSLKVPEK